MLQRPKSIIIYSPYSTETAQGNAISAFRLEKILEGLRYRVEIESMGYSGVESSHLIALNAWRSAEVIKQFRKQNPASRVIILITGSDINHEDFSDPDSVVRRSMSDADALVMLHDIEYGKLPADLQDKCTVIHPSVCLPSHLRHMPTDRDFLVMMSGNLRKVKHPRLAVEIAKILPSSSGVKIHSYGEAEGDILEMVTEASKELENYQWEGRKEHAETLEIMQHTQLLLNTSHAEGGANAICEALSLGIPVIATDIRGNRGMLGEDYMGFYAEKDASAGAALLLRAETDHQFYKDLVAQVKARAPLFSYANESKLWRELVKSIFNF